MDSEKGTYWLTYFRLDGDRHKELEREFQLNETVMRTLILKVDPRLVEALVQHATGATTAAEGKETATAGADKVANAAAVGAEPAKT